MKSVFWMTVLWAGLVSAAMVIHGAPEDSAVLLVLPLVGYQVSQAIAVRRANIEAREPSAAVERAALLIARTSPIRNVLDRWYFSEATARERYDWETVRFMMLRDGAAQVTATQDALLACYQAGKGDEEAKATVSRAHGRLAGNAALREEFEALWHVHSGGPARIVENDCPSAANLARRSS